MSILTHRRAIWGAMALGLALGSFAPRAVAQTVHVDEDFDNLSFPNIPAGWFLVGGVPTDWYTDYPSIHGCLPAHPASGARALICNDQKWAPPTCGVSNNSRVTSTMIQPPIGADILVTFDYIVSLNPGGGDWGALIFRNGQVTAPPPVQITSLGSLTQGSWVLGHQILIPAARVQNLVNFGGFQFEARLYSGGNVGQGGMAIDNLVIESVSNVTPYCFGDDPFACPCGNPSAPGAGEGCSNYHPSTGALLGGTLLSASGTPSISQNDLVLNMSQGFPGGLVLFLQSTGPGTGVFLSDGILCLTGSITRLQAVQTDGNGNAATTISISSAGSVSLPTTRYYQAWYRNVGFSPCGSNANLSSGLIVDWTP